MNRNASMLSLLISVTLAMCFSIAASQDCVAQEQTAASSDAAADQSPAPAAEAKPPAEKPTESPKPGGESGSESAESKTADAAPKPPAPAPAGAEEAAPEPKASAQKEAAEQAEPVAGEEPASKEEPAEKETVPANEKPAAKGQPAAEQKPAAKAAPAAEDKQPKDEEPADDEAAAEEAAPQQPQGPLQLATPTIAKGLKLSQEQREQIAALIAEREAALAALAEEAAAEDAATIEEKREEISAASDEALLDVLTEVQRGDFLGQPVDKRLQFMFRYQPWEDVLQWFAEQAELSLVLDRPPPGTFNYTDTREYTPQEAIDLLNGVLISKGFTLVRRGRMLMVIDMSEGIPEGIIPRVNIQDLPKRGDFEFVTVQFDLGRRDGEDVKEAIEPLLSPYSDAVHVSATRQLYVTDRAGIMDQVNQVIESIPEPVIKPTPPPPPEPQSPVVEVYPITKADPESALSVLQAMLPSATFVLDAKLNQINAHATPSQQSIVKSVLEQMEAGLPEQAQATLEVYPIDSFLEGETSATQLLETLQTAVPGAQVSINEDKQTLVAWAKDSEHETIKTVLEKLEIDRSPRETRQLEVYRLTKVDPDTTLELFETLVPDARLAVDAQTRSLIAVAVPADQEVIQNTLKTLQPAEPGPDTPELQFYELTLAMPPDFPDVIQKVAPNATVALDQSGMRLMVIASPAEHAKVEKTIQNLQKTTFVQGRPKLVFYPVTPSQRRRFDAVWESLSKELPGVSLVTDGSPGELAIWARPHQHEVIVEILEELKREVPETDKFQLVTYPVESEDPSAVLSMLETLYPDTKIVLDAAGERLLVWTSQPEHASIKQSLDELLASKPETTPTVETYAFLEEPSAEVISVLQELAPEAKISVDTPNRRLVVLATPEDQERIKTNFEQLAQTAPAQGQLELKAYPVKPTADLDSLQEMLSRQYPGAEIVVDAKENRLLVWAPAETQTTLQSSLDQLGAVATTDGQPRFESYPIHGFTSATSAQTLITTLQTLVPNARFTVDDRISNLIVWASPAEHEIVGRALERLGHGAAPQNTPQLEVYRLMKTDPTAVMDLLQSLVPDAKLSLDAASNSLIALAVPADHATIKATLDQLQPATAGPDAPQLRFHVLTRPPAEGLLKALEELVPDAEVTADAENERLSVVATPTDHQTVEQIVDQFESNTPPAEPKRLSVYAVTPTQRRRFESALSTLDEQLESVQVIDDTQPGELAVWATPSEHLVIADLLEELKSDVPAEQRAELGVYNLNAADAESVTEVLQRLFPDVEIIADKRGRKLMVWATSAEQERISKAVERIDAGEPGAYQESFRAYTLEDLSVTAVLPMLQELVPDAKLSSDPASGKILASATEADHKIVGDTIQQMQTGKDAQVVVYTVDGATSTNMLYLTRFLTTAVPNAKFSTGAKPDQLVAWASEEDQQEIKALVDQMTGGDTPQSAAVYPLQHITASNASTFLSNAVPDAIVSSDTEDPQRLTVWATQEDHDKITSVLEQIDVEGSGDSEATAMIYTIEGKSSSSLYYTLRFLGNTVPDAEFTSGANPGEIVAWATAKDHAQIQKLVDQITQDPAELEVYTLQFLPAEEVEEILESVVPRADITPDENNPLRMTVFASQAEHARIKDALQKIDIEGAGQTKAAPAVYRMEGMTSTTRTYYAMRLLASTFPDAEFATGSEAGVIVAWATPERHQEIKALIEQMGEEKPELLVYDLQFLSADSATEVLESVAPDAKITDDAASPKRLTVWATQSEHANIKDALQKLDLEGADQAEASPAVYRLEGVTSTTATYYIVRFLASTFPDAEFVAGAEAGTIVAWAAPEEQEKIKALTEQMGQEKPELQVYELQFLSADSATEVLGSVAPDAKITADAENPRRLTVWATTLDHANIKDALQKLDVEGDAEAAASAVVYKLQGMTTTGASYVRQFLATTFPDAEFVLGAEPGSLVAWATAEDHQRIQALVDQLAQQPADVAVYDLQFISAENAESVLASAVPEARVTVDLDFPQRVTVWATADDQAAVKNILDKIDIEGDPQGTEQVVIYSLAELDSRALIYAYRFLASMFPQAEFSPAAEPGSYAVWASAKEHEEIKALIAQLTQEPPPERAPKAVVYSLKFITAADASDVLGSAVPQAEITPHADDPRRMTVWARPTEHATIAEILTQIDVESDEETAATVAVYELDDVKSSSSMIYTLRLLTTAFPDAEFSLGTQLGQVVAWATPEEHIEIQTLFDTLNAGPPPEEEPTAVVYTLKHITTTAASQLLRTAVPDATVTTDTRDTKRLTIWASPADHTKIDSVLQQIDVEAAGEDEPTAAVYMLEDVASSSTLSYAYRLLTTAFPDATFLIGAQRGQFVAWATADDHAEIKALFEQLNAGPPPEEAPKAVVYSVRNITATGATQVLRNAVPNAELTTDTDDPQRFTAWATPEDHATIAAILQEIDVEGETDSGYTVAVYQLEDVRSVSSMTYTLRLLATAFAKAEFSLGTVPGQVVAWATEKDHTEIQALFDKLQQEAPDLTVYELQFISAANALTVLATAVPDAELTVDPDNPQRLTAWADAEDHATITTILEKIDVESDPEAGAQVVVYSLAEMDPRAVLYAYRFLAQTFPDARFSPGAESGSLVVWATPQDHQEIEQLIEQLTQAPPPERAPSVTVYGLKYITAADASQVLSNAVPQAEFTTGADDPQRLTAWARPDEHQAIAQIIQQIDVEGDPETQSQAVVYQLKGMDTRSMTYALSFLASAFPNAQFTRGSTSGSVVAWANAGDHQKIQSLVDQLAQESPQIAVYDLGFISAEAALEVLGSAVPEAELTADPDNPQRFTAWAIDEDQETIKSILAQIDVEADATKASRVVIYMLENMDARNALYAVRFLINAFPEANFTLGAEPGQLVAWAGAKDHQEIQSVVDQLNQKPPAELARTATVYSLQFVAAEDAVEVLEDAVPLAEFTVDTEDPQRLTAWARPGEHETIAEVLKTIDIQSETEPTAVVYTLEAASSTDAMRILREAVPQARLTIGSEPHQLIAWARPADHEVIAEMIERMAEKGPEELNPKVVVYTIGTGDAADAIDFLASAVPGAEFSVGVDPRRLIAWARPADHEIIRRAVDELAANADQLSTRVYRFRYADPQAAYDVLQQIVPTAEMAVDDNDQSLVVSGMPEDHEKIQATVDEMDRDDTTGQRPNVKIHPVEVGNASSVYRTLYLLFRQDDTVQLSLDSDSDAIIAIAPPAKHDRIADLIKQVETVAMQEDDALMELYAMRNVDYTAAMEILGDMLDKRGSKAEMSYDYQTNQMIVIGEPEDHELISKTLEQLRGEEPVLEIYELQYVDPMSAELAIGRQFLEEGMNAPQVDTDPVTQQLFIRATEQQQQEVRDLLIKMGETRLKLLSGRSGRSMRTFRLQGDVSEALREIQRIWPSLRENQIRVVSPDAPLPAESPEPAAGSDRSDQPDTSDPSDTSNQSDTSDQLPAENGDSRDPQTSWYNRLASQATWYCVAQAAEDEPLAEPETPTPATTADTVQTETAPQADTEPALAQPAPIYVMPGQDSLTVVSDDPAALQQFEELLRMLMPESAQIGRNISVFELKNSSATEVAGKLQQLFAASRSDTTWRRGALPVSIVPDDRLNTIVVQGSRIDRETIEGLIRVMDSTRAEADKPKIIPLKNIDANEAAEVVRDVFRSQMMVTGSSRSSSRTTTSSVRFVPSVSVDTATNSLIVMARSPLLEEIVELINTLDQGAGENPARRVKIVPLTKASSARVQEALDRILRSGSSTRRSSR